MTDEELWAATIAVEQAYDNREIDREDAIKRLCKLGFSKGEADDHLREGEDLHMPWPEVQPSAAVLGLRKAKAKPVEIAEETHRLPPTGTDNF